MPIMHKSCRADTVLCFAFVLERSLPLASSLCKTPQYIILLGPLHSWVRGIVCTIVRGGASIHSYVTVLAPTFSKHWRHRACLLVISTHILLKRPTEGRRINPRCQQRVLNYLFILFENARPRFNDFVPGISYIYIYIYIYNINI